jgi:hypothetical protein
VWKLTIPKLDENDILVFDLKLNWLAMRATPTPFND